jgi:hypothetical protein
MSQGFTKGTPIDTDPTLSLNSDIVVPSQKAVKSYLAANYQPTLVSGTNIKTVNGNSLLGSGDLIVGGGGLTVGTTPITSGVDGRVLFQSGGVVSQDSGFFWDNTNKRLGVGTTPATNARLDVRAQGALSTDIAFRVRNSADTADILTVNGNETTIIGRNQSTEPRLLINRAGSTKMLLGGTSDLNITFQSSGYGQINSGAQGLDIIASTGDIRTRNSSTFTLLKGNFFGIGQATPAARLDVRAQGALSTDIAFRVRNSADTANILTVNGNNFVGINTDSPRVIAGFSSVGLSIKNGATELFSTFQSGGVILGAGAIATNFNLNIITGVAIGLNAYSWQSSVSIGQNTSASSTTTVAIGNNTSAGGSAGSNIVSIGNNVNAATISGGGTKNVCIGSNLIAGRDNYEQIIIGADLGNRASSAGSLNVNRNIYIGGHLDNAVNNRTGVISLGFGVSSSSKINPNIDNSFSLYFSDNNRSFFVNKNTNVVMKSLGALTAGTDFDSSATNTFTVYNGTIPSINTSDSFQQYSADIVAGNAAPHFRTENGAVIKLYQVTTGIAAAAFVSNTSLIVNDSATYGGYTMGQVVAALKAQGLLA